ncbi:hypothetical protein SAMN04487906_2812 [Zhouia amylolytica]|uniref:Uncharacterized protein n=2 Tax=Zhouia amylolytica TaxID=376730 RepID=A0A1I6V234_9FLAO|nr:hypothetical protein SAMN04487906_2812 [Zhouia amylolytica]
MKKKKYHRKSDKEKLEALTELLSPRTRIDRESHQEVTFKVRDNCELRYVISCLLRVSIMAIESGEGDLGSPRMPYAPNESAIIMVLELINDILPHDQLKSYDKIEELLLSGEEIEQHKF